jgi:hypothetical protein
LSDVHSFHADAGPFLTVAIKSTHSYPGKYNFASGTTHEASVTVGGDAGDISVYQESSLNHRRSHSTRERSQLATTLDELALVYQRRPEQQFHFA